jgi:hypothetical protein
MNLDYLFQALFNFEIKKEKILNINLFSLGVQCLETVIFKDRTGQQSGLHIMLGISVNSRF